MLTIFICLLLFFHVVDVSSLSPSTTTRCHHSSMPSSSSALCETRTSQDNSEINKRRLFLQSALVTPFAIANCPVFAAEKPPPIIPLLTTAKRLHPVPLFTIVDGNGVPFHTYDKDSASGFGYFFTTYQSALYVLDDAKNAFAKAKEEAAKNQGNGKGAIGAEGDSDVPDAWGLSQIVTLPLGKIIVLLFCLSQPTMVLMLKISNIPLPFYTLLLPCMYIRCSDATECKEKSKCSSEWKGK